MCVCVCIQQAYADNLQDVVNQLLIFSLVKQTNDSNQLQI